MHMSGLEFNNKLRNNNGVDASFIPSSLCAITICKQHSANPIKPKSKPNIIKRKRNAAPEHDKAAADPKIRDKLKEPEIIFFTIRIRSFSLSLA